MSIKELRERTSAGMIDCKKAWEESNGDMDTAIKLLREKGLAKAVKRAGMDAAEGAVVTSSKGSSCGMIFFGTETDFVAKNDEFCKFANAILDEFLNSDVSDIKDLSKDGQSFSERLASLAGVIGENIIVKDFAKIKKEEGTEIFVYLHNKLNDNFDNVGKIGAMINLKGSIDEDSLKGMAMHIASFKPVVFERSSLTKEWLEAQEKEAAVVGETLESRIKGASLAQQAFLMDPSMTFGEFLSKNNLELLDFKVFSVK